MKLWQMIDEIISMDWEKSVVFEMSRSITFCTNVVPQKFYGPLNIWMATEMEIPSPFLEKLGILEYGGIPNVTEPNCLFDWGSAKIIHRTSVQLNLTSKP